MVKGKKDRHMALIVEDDLKMAEAVGDLLKSLGHGHIHAATQEEGLELMEQGGFCFALLDLQIKVDAEAIHAWVEAGHTLLRRIRAFYPGRNQDDQHYLQILAMSGHAKERHDVIQVLQNGADDFIVKPLGENNPPLYAKIQECLRKSGRDSHKGCAVLTELARLGSHQQELEGLGTVGPNRTCLSIPGKQQGKLTEVWIDDKAVFLTNASFLLLLKMIALRVGQGESWAHKSDLDPTAGEGWKGMSRLKGELRSYLPAKMDIYENDKKGGYRLNPVIALGNLDHDRLAGHWKKEVKLLCKEIKQLWQA